MENEGISEEKSTREIRHKVVLDFVRDISEGRLFLSVEQKKWGPQDIELIGNTTGRLIRDLSEYVSGAVAGEEFEFLEKQIFFSISVLRTYDTLKTNINESRVEAELRKLQFKVDALGTRIEEAFGTANKKSASEKERDRKFKVSPLERVNAPPQEKIAKEHVEEKNKLSPLVKVNSVSPEKIAKQRMEEKKIPDEEEGLF